MDNQYIVLDLETTYNSNIKTEEIIEISAIKITSDFNILEKFHKTINPKIPLTWITKKVTGITDEKIKDSPTFEQIIPELGKFILELPIIAHNASFDSKILKEHFQRNNLDLKNYFIDSLKISRELTPINKNSLSELKVFFNIKNDSHRAEEDVLSLIEILKHLDILYQNKNNKGLFENIFDYKINSEKQKFLTL